MNFKNLIGLEVDEAVKVLTDSGVDFKFTFCQSKKLRQYDERLVIAVRETLPVELVVGDFKFNVNK